MVIQSDPNCNYNAIDPGVIIDQEGKLWMSFGSFWGGIQLIELDPDTGTRIAPDSPITTLAHYDSIEAPHIYYHDGYYYLLLNWGMCCRGENSTYNMRMGRSKTITGPYLDKEGGDMLIGGGSLLLETDGIFIGPRPPPASGRKATNTSWVCTSTTGAQTRDVTIRHPPHAMGPRRLAGNFRAQAGIVGDFYCEMYKAKSVTRFRLF